MALRHESRQCPHCRRQVLALPQTPNYLFHAFLSVLTCGLYLPVALWIMVGRQFRCSQCGAKV